MKHGVVALCLALMLCVQQVSADITSNLTAWYKFDEGSGSTATDDGSGAHNGTLNADATYTTGHIGAYALSLDGTGDNVTAASGAIAGYPASGCTWVNYQSTTSATSTLFSNLGL